MINGLSQTLLKIASSGVADFYQGSELWDLRLVDPDNRGPIDFEVRKKAIESIANGGAPDDLMHNWRDGRIKLHLIRKALSFRRDHESLFREGAFQQLRCEGRYCRNIVAFIRNSNTETALIAVPRWLAQIQGSGDGGQEQIDWGGTRLMLSTGTGTKWNDVLAPNRAISATANEQPALLANELFRVFPVALFHAKHS
jgi:(1->4)-alpha-D-glucan 1-alpha-D-glucosylmutase